MQWYYAKNGTQLGPLDISALQAKIASGEVAPSDLVWRDGMPEWLPSARVAELQLSAVNQPPASPYAPPQAHPAAPAPYQPLPNAGQPLKNNLWQSIVVTILCCIPFGIVAIVYAAKVNGLLAAGNVQGAMEAAANSRKWTNIAVIGGLVIIILQVVIGIMAEK